MLASLASIHAKPRRVCVARPQGRGRRVDTVHVVDQCLDAPVVRVLGQPPVQRAGLGPLGLLAELRAHEEQLLAGVRPHEGQVGAQVGQLLPAVARHLAQQRTLAVHDLVVGDRQHVVLGVRVHHRERHLVVVVLAVDRLVRHVVQRVVHPAHVPLEAEPQTPEVGGPRDPRPRGRLLGDRHDPGHPLVRGGVHLLEERDGFEVLATAELVRGPLALLARVVEVQHRGHCVDAQPVDVELLQPVQRVGDEEVADLRTTEVEDVRAPVELLAALGVRVLVESGPVEPCECPRVLREVRRHPVDDHADACLVEPVDQVAEVVGVAEPGRRREVGRHLVAP